MTKEYKSLSIEDLRRLIKEAKEKEIQLCVVKSKKEALEFTKKDLFGHEWQIGEKYYLLQYKEDQNILVANRRRLTKKFFRRYDEISRFGYKKDKEEEAKKLGYQYISEAIFYEYYQKEKTLNETSKLLGFFSFSGAKYHLKRMEFLSGKKILRNRGGPHYKGRIISREEKRKICHLYLKREMGFHKIGKEMDISCWVIRDFIYRERLNEERKRIRKNGK